MIHTNNFLFIYKLKKVFLIEFLATQRALGATSGDRGNLIQGAGRLGTDLTRANPWQFGSKRHVI